MAGGGSKLPQNRRPKDGGNDRKAVAESVDQFLARAAKVAPPAPGGQPQRLLFAIDATASRQPSWDLATELHASLFDEVERLGNIAVQLAYYRGLGEFVASPWVTTPAELKQRMVGVSCRGGQTQLVRLLRHALQEATVRPVRALVFIGDCFEESQAEFLDLAGQLALRNLPLLFFQEGRDPVAMAAFSAAARLTGGAHVPFDPGSPDALRRLLGAAVRYATGGKRALEDFARRTRDAGPRALLEQIRD